MSRYLSRGACIIALLAGCSGQLFTPAGPTGGGKNIDEQTGTASPTEFRCSEDAAGVAAPLHRLSRDQYRHAVRDLIAASLPEAESTAVWNDIADTFANVPLDVVTDSAPFGGMDDVVSQAHIDTYFRTGERAARALTSTSERVQTLLACEGAADLACVQAFVSRFARRAYRREVSEAEVGFLMEVYGSLVVDAVALRDVLTVMLNAPEFIYHLELGGEPVAGKPDTYELTDYELASRIAFHFWQTAPDDALLDAAARGELSTDEGFAAAVDRALADPRARESIALFVREWFDLEKLKPLDALLGTPVFDAFVGDDVPSPDLRDDMVEEIVDSFLWHMERDHTFEEWFQSPYSFAKSAELAHIYGVGVWDGQSEPPRFPEGTRAGLITRAGLLSTGSANTRPIMKGVFLRERMLCDEILPPPAAASMIKIELSDRLTTREVVEEITEKAQPCAGCHQGQINGLGFATENYDALGRVRETQRLFSPEGQLVTEKPIDTVSIPRVIGNDAEPVANASELSDRMFESGKLEACFSRQYLRFTFARKDDLNLDGCALEDVRTSLIEGKGLKTAMRAMALRPEFRQRFTGEEK